MGRFALSATVVIVLGSSATPPSQLAISFRQGQSWSCSTPGQPRFRAA